MSVEIVVFFSIIYCLHNGLPSTIITKKTIKQNYQDIIQWQLSITVEASTGMSPKVLLLFK